MSNIRARIYSRKIVGLVNIGFSRCQGCRYFGGVRNTDTNLPTCPLSSALAVRACATGRLRFKRFRGYIREEAEPRKSLASRESGSRQALEGIHRI